MLMPIFVMMREHGQLWRTMDTLTDLLADGTDTRALGDTCGQLMDQLHQHNSKEEPIISSRADSDLPPHTFTSPILAARILLRSCGRCDGCGGTIDLTAEYATAALSWEPASPNCFYGKDCEESNPGGI
jgi:hypothetical protein